MSSSGEDIAGLPVAARSRWAPLRLGLVDLFHYDYQEFWFRDGRLLLRGNNGTGKSKVLALTLPFLLDGDISAHRVEPDADPKKRMEWNLLLDGQHEERLGYTWMELGRVTEDGERAYLTIGCGLKAVRGRGIADRWFFLTSQRIGRDLFLITPGGTALTRDRLEAAVGLDGQVLRTAEQYRRLVDEHLFQLGVDRYDALVDLLIQLRQPALSKRPDEGRLSTALSQALTPVDQAVLADIASALHDLEQQRDELAALRETRTSVDRFLTRYSSYAQVAARRQARALRRAQSGYEEAGRRLLAIRTELDAKIAERDQGETLLAGGRERVVALRAIKDELASRPELKDLEAAVRMATTLLQALTDADRRHRSAQGSTQDRHHRHVQATDQLAQAQAAAEAIGQDAARVAAVVGLGVPHREQDDRLAAALTGVRPSGSELGADVERLLTAAATRRSEACVHLAALIGVADDAARTAAAARRRLDDQAAGLQRARDLVDEAGRSVQAQADVLVGLWSAFLGSLSELSAGHPDDHGLQLWTTTLDGPNPSAAALHAAAAAARADLAATVARVDALRAVEADLLSRLDLERASLLDGVTVAPPPGHTRDHALRVDRPGAPFWQLVDFAAEVTDPDRAGIEAALEASGVLDAWLSPDGQLVDADGEAVVLAGPSAASNLGAVLRPSLPAEGGRLPAVSVVEQVLAGIGFLAGEVDPADQPHTWVGADGRFRLGVLRGRWHKAAAAFIGHSAREAARLRRLGELAAELAAAQSQLDGLDEQLNALADRQLRLGAELTNEPTDDDLRHAHIRRSQASEEVDRAVHRLAAEQEAATRAVHAHDEAVRDRDETATDLSLPATSGRPRCRGGVARRVSQPDRPAGARLRPARRLPR